MGKMNAAQMLAHCCEIQDVANGKDLKGTPFLVKLFKNIVRKTVVGEKPYKKNSPTHPNTKRIVCHVILIRRKIGYRQPWINSIMKILQYWHR